jgi:hypothetical protein
MSATPEGPMGRRPRFSLERLIQLLEKSPNVCDQRKAADLQKLVDLTKGPWSGRVALLGAECGQQWNLNVVLQMEVPGLAWQGQPVPQTTWMALLTVPHSYPMEMPVVRFVGGVPYCSHVIHREFLPDEGRLPPELRQFVEAVRAGRDGACCYMRHSQWSPAPTHDLGLVVWQVARIVSGTRLFGERGSLNNHARDYYQRLKDEGRLPLGPGLAAPWTRGQGGQSGEDATSGQEDASGQAVIPDIDDDDDAIEWFSEA